MYVGKLETKELEITGTRLLSVDEAKEYLTEEEREYYKGYWWLNTPYGHYKAACVLKDGFIWEKGHTVNDNEEDIYVRPALIINNLESTNFKVGDIFELYNLKSNKYTKIFKIISPDLAWMYKGDIGTCVFNKDKSNGNDYNESDIKKCVDEWWNKISSSH